MNRPARVYIVIVNWNGWQDTIECLESVFRSDYPDYRVIVCDNDSSDDSIENIRNWADGECFCVGFSDRLKCFSAPPVPKPVAYLEYLRGEFEKDFAGIDHETRLILVRTGSNLGFAGGNNVALRYLMSRDDWGCVWLLNNDTVIEPGALSALVRRMEGSPEVGMCGSLVPYYDKPDTIWVLGGGTFNRWLAKSACIGNGLSVKNILSCNEVEKRMKYVAGASSLVSKEFIEEIGLMCEDYFLYFEEPDWAFRGRHRFGLAYAPESIVYHKVGMSTKKGSEPGTNIDRPEDYIFRNSLKFTKTFFPFSLPFVFVRVAFNRIRAWFGSLLRGKRSGLCE